MARVGAGAGAEAGVGVAPPLLVFGDVLLFESVGLGVTVRSVDEVVPPVGVVPELLPLPPHATKITEIIRGLFLVLSHLERYTA